MRSGYSQQHAVSKEAVVDGIVVDGEEDDRKGHLRMFTNSSSTDIFYAFVEYGPLSDKNNMVEPSITQTACVDAWLVTVLRCLE